MSSGTTAHERNVCRTAVRWLCRRDGLPLDDSVAWADDKDSARPNVEGVFSLSSGRWLVEHTQIEAYPGQRTQDQRFGRLAARVDALRFDEVPAAFRVAFPIGYDAHLAGARDEPALVEALKHCLNVVGISMSPDERRWVEVAGVRVQLIRSRHYATKPVMAVRIWTDPPPLANLVRSRLTRKAKKFEHRDGRRILVLESAQIVLDMASVVEAARACPDELRLFDDVLVVETDEGRGPWFVYAVWTNGGLGSSTALPQEVEIEDSDDAWAKRVPGWPFLH